MRNNFLRLATSKDEALLVLGTVRSPASKSSDQTIEGIALIGGHARPSATLHDGDGSERARIALTEEGESLMRVNQRDGQGFAGLHTKGKVAWCGTGLEEGGTTRWTTSLGCVSDLRSSLLELGAAPRAGTDGTRSMRLLSDPRQSAIELRDATGAPRLRADASDRGENVTILDEKGTPLGGLTRADDMVGIGLGRPGWPSATLGIWKDRLRFRARDQNDVERSSFEIDPERKATFTRKDERGGVLEERK